MNSCRTNKQIYTYVRTHIHMFIRTHIRTQEPIFGSILGDCCCRCLRTVNIAIWTTLRRTHIVYNWNMLMHVKCPQTINKTVKEEFELQILSIRKHLIHFYILCGISRNFAPPSFPFRGSNEHEPFLDYPHSLETKRLKLYVHINFNLIYFEIFE